VVLIGAQGAEATSVGDVAAHRGFGSALHQVAISVADSVPRRYFEGGDR
jgi:hypothetical protein